MCEETKKKIGEKSTQRYKDRPEKYFVLAGWNKGIKMGPMSEEQKEKIRIFWREHPELLELRGNKISEGQKRRYVNETKEKAELRKLHRSEGVKRYYKEHLVTEQERKERSIRLKKYYKEHPEIAINRGKYLHEYYLKHPEKCKTISDNLRLYNYLHPRKLSEEHKKKLSISHTGLKHSDQTREKMSISQSQMLQEHPYAKNAYRKDLKHRTRSTWEANVCRILNYFNEFYDYEKYTFELGNALRYTPDIYLPKQNIYLEIKGYLSDKAKLKITKFKEKYPDKKLIVIDTPIYNRLREEYKPIIHNWEK